MLGFQFPMMMTIETSLDETSIGPINDCHHDNSKHHELDIPHKKMAWRGGRGNSSQCQHGHSWQVCISQNPKELGVQKINHVGTLCDL